MKKTLISAATAALLGAAAFVAFANTTGSLLPSSDGSYSQWTPSTGTTHYTLVDETTCNGTTDYVRTTTVGNRDSYGISLGSIANGSTITGIELTPCASKNASGGVNSTMNVFYRWNGTDSADAGSYSLTGTTPVTLTATNFTSLSLVKGSASTLEIGAVLSAGTKGARLSRLAAVITYTPLVAPSNLSGAASGSDVALNWTDNATNEDGFTISRSSDGVNFTGVGTTTADVTSYTDAGLGSGTWYHKVRAYNSGGYSAFSNTATTTIP